MRVWGWRAAVLGVVALAAGAAAPRRRGRCRAPAVPAYAPDTVPRWVLSDDSLTAEAPDMRGVPVVRGLLVVIFRAGATRAERQAAVDAVCGRVVGGRRNFPPDGEYVIRVPLDAAGAGVRAAQRTLVALPQVAAAGTERAGVIDLRARP